MNPIEQLKSVLCDPSGKCCIAGSDEDRAIVDRALQALAEQPKYCRGDRLICLETEEYCVIHISGTDRQWVKFPDAHIGVYKNEQLAELFELLPKEIEIEQPAQQEPVAKHYVDGGRIVYPAAQRTSVEMSDVRIKGIFSSYGQFVSGKELAMLRVIEAMLKENT